MEKMLSARCRKASSTTRVYRYEGQNQPVDFASPPRALALEQVLNVTLGPR